jgi:hypothetical protein
MTTQAKILNGIASVRAGIEGSAVGTASLVDSAGIRKWLRVSPSKPQEITWVRMGDIIQYDVECNTRWNIA